ncbi:hypothetical protein PMAYCL1PPCAC_26415, partial [Pristionchus mayeri]
REALNGTKVHEFSVSIECDRRWESEDAQALTQLIISTNAKKLRLDPHLIHNGLIIGRFMRVCAPTLQELLSIDKTFVGAFPAPKVFLPILTGYSYLLIPAITIQAEWIGEVCMKLLDRVHGHRNCDPRFNQWPFAQKPAIIWRISVSREITPRQLSRQISNPGFK